MYIDRDTVIELLDTESNTYDLDISVLKELPEDTMLELNVGSKISASYFKDDDTRLVFPLKASNYVQSDISTFTQLDWETGVIHEETHTHKKLPIVIVIFVMLGGLLWVLGYLGKVLH